MLNDPQTMEQVKNMMNMLNLGGNENNSFTNNNEAPNEGKSSDNGSMGFDPAMLMQIKAMMDSINNAPNDRRSTLLMALKPYLSSKRSATLDKSVQILKMTKLMPLITQFLNNQQ